MTVSRDQQLKFEKEGLLVIESVLSTDIVRSLKQELEKAIRQDIQQSPDVFDVGMVHNCMVRGKQMERMIAHPILNDFIDALFTPHAIIYAYQSSSLNPKSSNYGSRVHVDCPRFIPNYMTNLGVIITLDDFTSQNGGTHYLPGSHLSSDVPSDEKFKQESVQLECQRGSFIFFNGRVFHAAGINRTNKARHALTINYCRPYMRQRFDFPRLIPKEQLDAMDKHTKKRIGYDVRIPTSLDEFYLPAEERLYKPGQE